jgi:hypothetical protein
MKNRSLRNGSSPNGFERFEYLAQRLFAVEKREVDKNRDNFEARKIARKNEPPFEAGFPANLRRFAMKVLGKSEMKCSFCGKTAEQVRFLLAGGGTPPTVYICGDCVDISADIVEKAKASGNVPPAP